MPIIYHYKPSNMAPNELEQMFISKKGREVFDQILVDLQRRIHKSSNQHYLILGRRGIGKSHLMANIYYALTTSPSLNRYWLPLWLSEEEYAVTSIRDLSNRILEKISNALSGAGEDSNFKNKIETFKKNIESHDANEDIFKLTTSFIKDLSNLLKKRFVVIIENFNMYLKSIDSHQEKILRSLLMNDTTLLFIASAPTIHTYLSEVADPKNALYNLFDVHYLGEFSFEECRDLLKQRSLMDNNNHLHSIIETGDFKLEPIYVITGGNPRLMLLFYRLAGSLETIRDVKRTLIQLLDQLTPYFQGKIESLPDQQRKILIEFTNGMENLTPAEIGKRIHLPTNQVTAQVRNLVKNGFVNIVDKEGDVGGTLYEPSERIFRYWYRYRNGRDTQWLDGLIDFISSWVSLNELKPIKEMFDEERKKYQKTGRLKQCIIEGVELIFSRKYREAFDTFNLLTQVYPDEMITFLYKAFASIYLGNHEQAISCCADAITLNVDEFRAYSLIGICHLSLNRPKNALDYLNKGLDRSFDRGVQIEPPLLITYIYFVLTAKEFNLAKQVIEVLEKKIAVLKKENVNAENCLFLGLFRVLINFLITGDKNLLDRQPFEIREILKEMSSLFLSMEARINIPSKKEKKGTAKEYRELSAHFTRVIDLMVLDSFNDFMRDNEKDEMSKQIKVLAVTASPDDMEDIFYEQEQDTLLNAFQEFDNDAVYLDMPDPVKSTLDEIKERLEDGKHDILHITAHGGINDNGEGVLCFEDHRGKLETVTGSQLAELLKGLTPAPLMVILSACHSARPELGLMPTARALFDAGIAAVIGMDKAISHAAAIEFNGAFFTALCGKNTIKGAFEAGKEAIFKGEQRRIKENPNWNTLKEYEIPQCLARDENLGVESFSDHRIEAPGRPQSYHFQGARYLERGFIGRRRVLREIFHTIANKEGAVILKGPGGIGKSTLTTRIAANLLRKGYDFIIIRGDASEAKILEAISNKATELGVEGAKEFFTASSESVQKLGWFVENFLGPRRVMIIFDNFEENQDEGRGDFGSGKESLKEFLWCFKDFLKNKESFLFFSTRYALPGFEGPDMTKSIPEFTVVEFRKMLWNGKALKRLDGKSIETLQYEIGGNPRALELLDRIAYNEFNRRDYSWEELKDLVPELLLRIIEKKGGSDDFAPLFLDKLIGYLNPVQRLIIEVLSIYRNPLPVEAVAIQGVEMTRADINRLVDLSLLEYIEMGNGLFYYVHRLTAQYILDSMEMAIKNKYHLQASHYFEGIRDEEGKHNLNDVIESRWHYLQAGEWNRAAEITFELEDYLTLHGFPQWSMKLLIELEEKELTDKNRSIVYHQIGMLFQGFGDYEAALTRYQQSLEIAEKIGYRESMANCYGQIGMIYQDKGDYAAALTQYQKALEIAEKIGNIKCVSNSLHQIGMIYQDKGEYDAALTQYQKSLEIAEKIGDIKGVSNSLHQIGRIYQYKGDYDAALTQYQKSLEIAEKIGDIKGVATSLHQIGMIYQYKGDDDAALSQYQKSLEIAEKIGDIAGMAISMGQMGNLFFDQNQFETALKLSLQAFAIFAKIGSPNANIVKHNISRCREKMTEERFQAILKEFGVEG